MEHQTPLTSDAPPDMPVTPDAHGSGMERCARAVLAIIRRPSRATFTTWMRVAEPAWIPRMLLVGIALDMLSGLASLAIGRFIAPPAASPPTYLFGVPSLADRFIYALVVLPLYYLIQLALTVLGAAALKPAGQERTSIGERARQILRPYLLALIVVGLVSLVIDEPIAALQASAVGQNPLVSYLAPVISLATSIYWLVVVLNALAAGSGVSRWLLFAVLILAGIVSAAIALFGLGALLSLVGIHLPIGL